MTDAFYYTDAGSLSEYFGRLRLPDGAADDALLEYLLYALDTGQMVLSPQLSPPWCLYLKTITPVRGQRGFNPCPLVVIRNATGNGDPTRIRLLVRKRPEPAKPPVPERAPLHRWPEDEPPPTSTPPSVRSAPDGKPKSPKPASDEPPIPKAQPAKSVPVKVQRKAQTTKRKARRKAERDKRIDKVAELAKGKPNLTNVEIRERQPGKMDFYTECQAAIPGLAYNELKAGLKIERRRRAEAKATARKS